MYGHHKQKKTSWKQQNIAKTILIILLFPFCHHEIKPVTERLGMINFLKYGEALIEATGICIRVWRSLILVWVEQTTDLKWVWAECFKFACYVEQKCNGGSISGQRNVLPQVQNPWLNSFLSFQNFSGFSHLNCSPHIYLHLSVSTLLSPYLLIWGDCFKKALFYFLQILSECVLGPSMVLPTVCEERHFQRGVWYSLE